MEERHTMDRKFKKHMVEKRRRTRINHALLELKELVLEAFSKDPTKYDKMEKADILDLTVKYLHRIHMERVHRPLTALTAAERSLSMFLAAQAEGRSESLSALNDGNPAGMSSRPVPSGSLGPSPSALSTRYQRCMTQSAAYVDVNNNNCNTDAVPQSNVKNGRDSSGATKMAALNHKATSSDASSSVRVAPYRIPSSTCTSQKTAIVKPRPRHALNTLNLHAPSTIPSPALLPFSTKVTLSDESIKQSDRPDPFISLSTHFATASSGTSTGSSAKPSDSALPLPSSWRPPWGLSIFA